MAESKSNKIDIHHANIRLCRLRSWPNYDGLGFHITPCSRPPHMISLVESNSPAAAGGLKIWDVLIAINNEFVSNADYNQIIMILNAAAQMGNHRCIELLVVEEDFYPVFKKKNIRINSSLANIIDTPIQMPDDYIKFPRYTPRTYEIRLQTNDQHFGFNVTHGEDMIGVYIQEVISGSPANRVGLRKSDRIIKIDDKYVDKSSSKSIYEKLNKGLIKRNIKLFVMDTETYRVVNNLNINVDRDDACKVSAIPSVASSDHDSGSSSISNQSDQLNYSPFNHEPTRKNSKDFHVMNAPVIRIKPSLSPQLDTSNAEQNNQNIQVFHYETANTITTEYEDLDSNNQHNATETTTAVSLQQNNHYEDLNSPSIPSDFKYIIIDDIQNEPLNSLSPIEDHQDVPLMSLNNAVENLEKIIPQIKRNASIALENSANDPMDELTSDESAAIQLHTMEWKPGYQSLFVKLNHVLRANDRSQLTPYYPYLKLVLTALGKLKSLSTSVWCGAHTDLRAQYQIGKIFVWWGFSLCIESRDLLESDQYLGNKGVRTLFHIECKTGKSIRFHSHSKQEHEILLLPATQFQVMNQETLTDDLFIIYLREIKPKDALLQLALDADYSIVSPEININNLYQNESLQKFIDDHKMKNSICFSEQSLTINDMHLITNELHSNKSWNKLSIYRTCLNDEQIKCLMYTLQSNLIVTSLDLKSNQLNDDTCSIIALALKTNRSLENVDLTDNQITEIGAQSFATMLLINKTLFSLNLSSNAIGDKGMICIFRALQHNSTLKSLYLNRTKVTDKGIIDVPYFLMKTTRLNGLHLAMNNITSIGAKTIATFLQQSTNSLLELNLSGNRLKDAGVASIARALLKNTTLIELYLDEVEITINSVEEIANMICSNQTLKSLSLKKNGIDDDGMILLFNGFKFNNVLTHLYLNDNKLTDRSITDTIEKVNNTQTLKCLYFSDNQTTKKPT